MRLRGFTKKIFTVGVFAVSMLSVSTSLTGCLTNSKTAAAPKDTATPWGANDTLLVGAQGNTQYGTAMDLDAKKVMLASEAKAAQSTIDLLFVFTGGMFEIAGPKAAKSFGDVPLATAYDSTQIKDIQFARISTKPTTSQLGDSTFAATPKVTDAGVYGYGEPFLVKTGAGKLVYVEVTTITGTDSTAFATIVISQSGL